MLLSVGGGAGGAGQNGPYVVANLPTGNANGGPGLLSSINGSTVYYAGGGAGSVVLRESVAAAAIT